MWHSSRDHDESRTKRQDTQRVMCFTRARARARFPAHTVRSFLRAFAVVLLAAGQCGDWLKFCTKELDAAFRTPCICRLVCSRCEHPIRPQILPDNYIQFSDVT